MQPWGKVFRDVGYTVAFYLLPVWTGLWLLLMPDAVGAEWPGWSSVMLLVILVAVPAATVLIVVSHGAARTGRWIVAAAITAVMIKVVWTLAQVGPVLVVAAAPILVMLVIAVLLVVYSWPRATRKDLAELAAARGWQARTELPPGLDLPVLPLPVGRFWVIRNVIQSAAGTAFEVRWLEFRGVLARRRRLAVFVAPKLAAALPFFEVRPGSGLTRSDLSLESLEFNRSFDVLGEDPRYLMAVLHPRTMQALLDARPIGLTVAADALVAYDTTGLTPESVQRGFDALARISIPAHVLTEWGRPPVADRPGLRFELPFVAPTRGVVIARIATLCTATMGITLLTALAAAYLESRTGGEPLDPAQPVGTLVVAAAVLLLIATACALYGRRRPAYGSASA